MTRGQRQLQRGIAELLEESDCSTEEALQVLHELLRVMILRQVQGV